VYNSGHEHVIAPSAPSLATGAITNHTLRAIYSQNFELSIWYLSVCAGKRR